MKDIMKWELLKQQIAEIARTCGRETAQENRLLLENLYKLKTVYVNEYDTLLETTLQHSYKEICDKITELEKAKTDAVIFRSRALWAREGEKSSKYFLSLEKRNYYAKTMFSIILDDGTVCKEQKKISGGTEEILRGSVSKSQRH